MAARRRRGFFLRRFSSGEAAEPGRLRICGRDVSTVLPEKPAEFSSRAGGRRAHSREAPCFFPMIAAEGHGDPKLPSGKRIPSENPACRFGTGPYLRRRVFLYDSRHDGSFQARALYRSITADRLRKMRSSRMNTRWFRYRPMIYPSFWPMKTAAMPTAASLKNSGRYRPANH